MLFFSHRPARLPLWVAPRVDVVHVGEQRRDRDAARRCLLQQRGGGRLGSVAHPQLVDTHAARARVQPWLRWHRPAKVPAANDAGVALRQERARLRDVVLVATGLGGRAKLRQVLSGLDLEARLVPPVPCGLWCHGTPEAGTRIPYVRRVGPRGKLPCASIRTARRRLARVARQAPAHHVSIACGHELLVHSLDEDGAATAVQAGAVRDLANVLHLAMRSCRQEQEHACAAEHPFLSAPRRRQQDALAHRGERLPQHHASIRSSVLRRQCCIIAEPRHVRMWCRSEPHERTPPQSPPSRGVAPRAAVVCLASEAYARLRLCTPLDAGGRVRVLGVLDCVQ